MRKKNVPDFTTDMSIINIALDSLEGADDMVEMLQRARSHVFCSMFVLHLDEPIVGQEGLTMRRLFWDLHKRGVTNHILYNGETAYGNLPVSEFKAALPPSAQVKVVVGDGKVDPWLAAIIRVPNTRYSNHHQKYVCVDDREFMLGNVDINYQRTGWMQLNKHGYSWHETSVRMTCTPRIAQFVRANFFQGVVNTPPFPLTRGMREYRLILRMIDSARSCIHMEMQTCVSARSTSNEVFEHVLQRLLKAQQNPRDTFRFMLLTNLENPDESAFVSFFLENQLQWSRRFLRERAAELGITDDTLQRRLFIGKMRSPDGKFIKVHSNLVIQDGSRMLRTSSNFSDRSMSALPCDNELGIVVEGDEVARVQQELWRRYFMCPEESVRLFLPEEAFECMCKELGVIRRIRFREKDDTTLVPDCVVNVLSDIVNSVNAFGGKKKINWSYE